MGKHVLSLSKGAGADERIARRVSVTGEILHWKQAG